MQRTVFAQESSLSDWLNGFNKIIGKITAFAMLNVD
jgi:hypothetical protein